MNSRDFRADLFTVREEYEETPLRDRKAHLPILQRSENRQRFLEDKAEFIRDVIALANTARLFGRPAYLIYGIDDDGNIAGLERSLVEHGDVEQVRQNMGDVIREYIRPLLPKFRFRCGEAKGKRVAYLIIHPIPSQEPFRVGNRFPGRGRALVQEGSCWIRFGESKRAIGLRDISEAPHRYSYAQTPYILPSKWVRYFESILSDEDFIRAVQIPAYQDLRIENSTLKETVEEFLTDISGSCLVIKGEAGSGKTAFLRRFVYRWANTGKVAMQEARNREEFTPPPGWIPLYFSLRDADIQDEHTLNRVFLYQINGQAELWGEEPESPERLFEYPDLHWLLCIDGLDEMWDIGRQRCFLGALRSFMRRYSRVRVLLTTRPDVTIPSDFQQIRISELTQEQVLAYASHYSEENVYEDFLDVLEAEPDLWTLCANPTYLAAAMEVVADAFPPRLEEELQNEDSTDGSPNNIGTFKDHGSSRSAENLAELPVVEEESMILDQPMVSESDETRLGESRQGEEDSLELLTGLLLSRIFENLWKREEERRPLRATDADEWWDTTGELAIWMDGRRRSVRRFEALEYIPSEEGLHWVLSLGVLRNRRGWFGFTNCLIRDFFAAAFLERFAEEEIYDEAHKYVSRCTKQFQTRVRELLNQITYANLEPLFTEVNHEC
jgi:hypothetical protein